MALVMEFQLVRLHNNIEIHIAWNKTKEYQSHYNDRGARLHPLVPHPQKVTSHYSKCF